MTVERNTNKTINQSVKASPKQTVWGKTFVQFATGPLYDCILHSGPLSTQMYRTTELQRTKTHLWSQFDRLWIGRTSWFLPLNTGTGIPM